MKVRSTEKHLSHDAFEEACKGRRFTDRGRQIAYAQLVSNRPVEEVAAEYGISRSRAQVLARAVFTAHLDKQDQPPGWITATVSGPEELIRKLNAEAERQLKAWHKRRRKQ